MAVPAVLVAGMAASQTGSGVVASPALAGAVVVGAQTALVSPAFGPPGAVVYASGHGWPARDAIAIVSCEGSTGAGCGAGATRATAVAGPDGGFAGVPVAVPAVRPQSFLTFHFQDLEPGRATLTYEVPFTVTGLPPAPQTPEAAPEQGGQVLPPPAVGPWSWVAAPPPVEVAPAERMPTPSPSPYATPYPYRQPPEGFRPQPPPPTPEPYRPPPTNPPSRGYHPQPSSPPSGGGYRPPPHQGGGYQPPPPPPRNGGGYQPPPRSQPPPPPPPRNGGGYQPPPPPPHRGGGWQPPPRTH